MAAAEPTYTYRASLVRATDGDTYDLLLDFGRFAGVQVKAVVNIRLRGIDTWELSRSDTRGDQAKFAAEYVLSQAKEIIVKTYKDSTKPFGKTFDRTLADVWVDGVSMVEIMEPHRKHAS